VKGVHPKWLSSRLGESLAPWYQHGKPPNPLPPSYVPNHVIKVRPPSTGPLENLVHTFGKDFVMNHWAKTSNMLREVLQLKEGDAPNPESNLPYGMSRVGITDGSYYSLVREGKIKVRKDTQVAHMCANSQSACRRSNLGCLLVWMILLFNLKMERE
jgi:hypothetical protein